MRAWWLLALALLSQGCLGTSTDADTTIFMHTWGSCLLLLGGIAAGAAVSVITFVWAEHPILTRLGALTLACTIMAALVTTPSWLIDRAEVGPAGFKLRVGGLTSISRYDVPWASLSFVSRQFGGKDSRTGLSLTYKDGRPHETIHLDDELLHAISPVMARHLGRHQIEFFGYP